MYVIAVQPGASFATQDVYAGFTEALIEQGHMVRLYRLDNRIERSQHYLMGEWRKLRRDDPQAVKPTQHDIFYWAGRELIDLALRTLPDWVVVFSGMYLHPDVLLMLQRAGVRVALVLSESPYDDDHQQLVAPYADVVFTNERTSVERFTMLCQHVEYLPHAFNPTLHQPLEDGADRLTTHNVCFVGTAFKERIDFLSAVDWSGIDLGLYGEWSLLGSRNPLRRFVRGKAMHNRDAVEIYRQSDIGLNLYRTSKGFGRSTDKIDHAESLNPRAYELAACGVFQVSDYRAEVEEVFGPSVPTFRTPDELQGILKLAMADPDWRQAMADEAHQRVQRHTFGDRARRLTDVLERVHPLGVRDEVMV